MVGVYLSGMSNTQYCTERLVHLLDEQARTIPLENERAAEAIRENEKIVLAYPVQYSNVPMMVREFIRAHADLWTGKQVLCLATMGAFSGDGAGCAARLLNRYGAEIMGGLHLRMPNSRCDGKAPKTSQEQNRRIVSAEKKIEAAAVRIKVGKYPKDGLGFCRPAAGLLGQRLWSRHIARRYSDRLSISAACAGCGQCAALCPMENIVTGGGRSPATDAPCAIAASAGARGGRSPSWEKKCASNTGSSETCPGSKTAGKAFRSR